jgi:hypothetical protein
MGKIYTLSRFRPLALLRFKTFMPPWVRILALKPWVRALFILLGWKVLFMVVYSPIFLR